MEKVGLLLMRPISLGAIVSPLSLSRAHARTHFGSSVKDFDIIY